MSAASIRSDVLSAAVVHCLSLRMTTDSSEGTDEAKDRGEMSVPLLWGFLVTLFLGVIGYYGLLASRSLWPLLWLPLLSPVLGILYLIFFVHSTRDLNRYLAGFGIGLVTIMAVGVLLVLAIYYGILS